MMAATDTHATIEGLLKTAFPVRSVPRLYNEDQLSLGLDPCGGEVEYLHRDPASS
jgi:hypothetical protein